MCRCFGHIYSVETDQLQHFITKVFLDCYGLFIDPPLISSVNAAFVYEAWRRAHICWSTRAQVLWAHQIFWGLVLHVHLLEYVILKWLWFCPQLSNGINICFCRWLKECQKSGLDIILLHGCLRLLLLLKRIVLEWTLRKFTENQTYFSMCNSLEFLLLILLLDRTIPFLI